MRINIENRKELNDYLVKHQQFQKDELTGFQLLSGGVSNRTVMVRLADGKAWVIKQALEKLRVKTDWFCDPARIFREAEAVRFLHARVPQARVPRFCFEDPENYLLGMESIPEPHQVWKSELLKGQVDAELVIQFAEMLAGIHGCSMETPGLPEVFSDKTYFEALRLEPYYGYAASQIPKAETFFQELMESTRHENRFLVHGDFSPKNILAHQKKLHLIDHEVIHLGDGAFDLGFALTHLLAKSLHVPGHRVTFQEACHLFADRYLQSVSSVSKFSGIEERWIKHTLGCLLARVHGRSPLEYLKDSERALITEKTLECLDQLPSDIHTLIDRMTWQPS